MTNEPRFDPMKEIQNVGEQLTKEIEKTNPHHYQQPGWPAARYV